MYEMPGWAAATRPVTPEELAKFSKDPIVTERRAKREAPGPHFVRVAAVWSAILGHTVTAEQVVLCMAGLKLAREAGQHDPDNVDDIKGYISLIPEVRAYLRPRQPGTEYAEDRFP